MGRTRTRGGRWGSIALGLALVFLAAAVTANPVVVGIFVGLFGLGSVYFQFVAMPKLRVAGDVDTGIAPAPAIEP